MAGGDGNDRTDMSRGLTLYLESDTSDREDAICIDVFGDDVGDHRVVQLLATQSLEPFRGASDAQVPGGDDPSAAAAIVATPHADDGTTTVPIDEELTLRVFQTEPEDLTGISMVFSRLIDEWADTDETISVCIQDLESLSTYHESDVLFRFLNTLFTALREVGADVHAHVRPEAIDDRTLKLLESLFDRVVDREEPSDRSPATIIDEAYREVATDDDGDRSDSGV